MHVSCEFGHFWTLLDTLEMPGVSPLIVNTISHDSKIKNWKNLIHDFLFDSGASFMKMGAILRGGGLHILVRENLKFSQRLLVAWTNILLDCLQNLVESMYNRMKQSKM